MTDDNAVPFGEELRSILEGAKQEFIDEYNAMFPDAEQRAFKAALERAAEGENKEADTFDVGVWKSPDGELYLHTLDLTDIEAVLRALEESSPEEISELWSSHAWTFMGCLYRLKGFRIEFLRSLGTPSQFRQRLDEVQATVEKFQDLMRAARAELQSVNHRLKKAEQDLMRLEYRDSLAYGPGCPVP